MIKTILHLISAITITGFFASAIYAAPVVLNASQLDAVAAGGVERIDGFVCPVISTDAVLNSPKGGAIYGGDYTIGGPEVSVPMLATNGNGTGSPAGAHSAPGDTDYTAIWDFAAL